MLKTIEVYDWFKVLDVQNAEDAAAELRLHINRLDGVHDEIQQTLRALFDAPGEIDGILRVARSCVGEAIDALDAVQRHLESEADLEARGLV